MKFLEDHGVVADGHMGAAATDNANALEDFFGQSALDNPGGLSIDNGGVSGEVAIPPRGQIMIGRSLNMPNGLVWDGGGSVSNVILLKTGFDPTKALFVMGDQTVHPVNGRVSSFGTAFRNTTIIDHNQDVAYGTPLIFTDNVQDTHDMIAGVRLYCDKRWPIKAIKGIGGASFIHMRDCITVCREPHSVNVLIDYGEGTQVVLEKMEPASSRKSNDPANPLYNVPADGTVGVMVKGGKVRMSGFHSESILWGVGVDLKATRQDGTTLSKFQMEYATGGPASNSVVTIYNNPRNTGRVKLREIEMNGATHAVVDGRNGHNPVDTDIGDWMTF